MTAPLRILLADDEHASAEFAATVLRAGGCDVTVVGDGTAAVAAARAGVFDLVLLDIEMPGLSGHEAAAALRDDPRTAGVPTVALTAHLDYWMSDDYRQAGFTTCMVKPVTPGALLALVETVARAGRPAAARTAGGRRTPLDVSGLVQVMRDAGIEEAAAEILQVFAEDAPDRMRALAAALTAGDTAGIRAAAHAYRSAALTARAGALADVLGLVEGMAEAGNIEGAQALVGEVTERHEEVMRALGTL